jgi:hypothetical protein
MGSLAAGYVTQGQGKNQSVVFEIRPSESVTAYQRRQEAKARDARRSTNRGDRLDQRSSERGVSSGRASRRIFNGTAALEVFSTSETEQSFSVSETLYKSLTSISGKELLYPCDAHLDPAFAAGTKLSIRFGGKTHQVTLGEPYRSRKELLPKQDRWRVPVIFDDMAKTVIRITMAQLQRVVVPVIVAQPVVIEKAVNPVIPPDPAILLLPAWTATRSELEIAEITFMKQARKDTAVFERFARHAAGVPECSHCDDTGTTGHWSIVGGEATEEVCPHCAHNWMLIGAA